MKSSNTQEMTSGRPLPLILGFMIPCMLSSFFYELYGIIDAIIVGRCLGVDALAAVGSTSSIQFMISGFCLGVCNGFVIPVAQAFGAREYEKLRRYVANSVWVASAMAAAVTFLVCSLCMPVLIWMKTPEHILGDAYKYIFIIFLGIPLLFGGNITSGIIRSLGNSRTPLYFSVISTIVNIILDVAAIRWLHMGVAGAAGATVISQFLVFALNMVYILTKCQVLRIRKEEWRLDRKIVGNLCRLGLPMGLQFSITAIGSVAVQTAVNTLGTACVASVTAAHKVMGLLGTPVEALGVTMTTYAGQNAGAGRVDRIKTGARIAVLIGCIYAVLEFGVLFFFGREITQLLVGSSETEVLEYVYRYFMYNGPAVVFLVLINVWRLAIQGMGYTGTAMFAGVFEMAARVGAAFLLVPSMGFQAVCLAAPLAWGFADLFLLWAYPEALRRLERQGVPRAVRG